MAGTLPANLRDHIEGIRIIKLLEARQCQLRELQAVKGSAVPQDLQLPASISAPGTQVENSSKAITSGQPASMPQVTSGSPERPHPGQHLYV